jgi:hypothetical protein
MIKYANYELTFLYNNKDLGIDNLLFERFTIVNEIDNIITYYLLELTNSFLFMSNVNIVTGEKIEMKLVWYKRDDDGKEVEDGVFTKELYIYNFILKDNRVSIMFLDEVGVKMFNRVDNVYVGNVSNVLNKICDELGIKKREIYNDNTSMSVYHKSDINYYVFIKNVLWNSNGGYFFVNKKGIAKFDLFKNIKNITSRYTLSNILFKYISIENRIFEFNLLSGFNNNIYYFDWEKGKMMKKEYKIINDSDYGVGVYLNLSNSFDNSFYGGIVNSYNKIDKDILENRGINNVIYKNIAKLAVYLSVNGGYVDVDMGDKIKVDFVNLFDRSNYVLTGEYFVYRVNLELTAKGVMHNYTLLSSYIFDKFDLYKGVVK